MLRRTYFTRLFFVSPKCYNAFSYIERLNSQFPDELKFFIQSHIEFSKKLNAKTVTIFEGTTSLGDIRATYTSKNLDDIIQQLIEEEIHVNNVPREELINISRMIIKWCARERMYNLGFTKELDDIHRDNLDKYGNIIGPTLSFLKQKYQDDPHAMANASKRFRADNEMQKIIK